MARKPSSAERARRLIALLGRLVPGSRIPIRELAETVGTSPEDLAVDLELLSVCGVAPYTPLDLVPVYVEDGDIVVWGDLPALEGPVRLSGPEARALAAALQAAGLDTDDELVSRLLLITAAGAEPDEIAHALRASVTRHTSQVYETMAQSCAEGDVVRIVHQRGGKSEESEREIEPDRLFVERGVWYVTAYCRRADAPRTFRLDRIKAADPTGERFASRPGDSDQTHAFSAEGLPVATLAFAGADSFHLREWPGAEPAGRDEAGRLLVRVPYAGTDWVARQVLARLGEIEALGPTEVREAVAELARAELASRPERT